jgi:hypothetical protein
MVASKCSRNHFISKKYETVKSFKILFPQNSALIQIYATPSDCNSVGNIPGSHFVQAFSARPSRHKSAVLPVLISIEGKGKNHPEAG